MHNLFLSANEKGWRFGDKNNSNNSKYRIGQYYKIEEKREKKHYCENVSLINLKSGTNPGQGFKLNSGIKRKLRNPSEQALAL